MKTQVMVFFLTAYLLTGCVSDGSSKDVTSEEKALTYLEMGVRYMEMGELKFAKEGLEKALDLDANNAEIHNTAAALYERIHEPENARTHYQASMQLDPQNSQSQNNYGRFLCETGSLAEGMGYLEQALKTPLNNRRWYALTNAGRCLLKQGQRQQAENYFREALLLQGDYPPALLEMMKLSYSDGNSISAKAFAQRFQNVSAPTPEFLWYAMQIESALDHKSQALQYKNALLTKFPLSDEAKRARTAILE